jgi:hypothetical protein
MRSAHWRRGPSSDASCCWACRLGSLFYLRRVRLLVRRRASRTPPISALGSRPVPEVTDRFPEGISSELPVVAAEIRTGHGTVLRASEAHGRRSLPPTCRPARQGRQSVGELKTEGGQMTRIVSRRSRAAGVHRRLGRPERPERLPYRRLSRHAAPLANTHSLPTTDIGESKGSPIRLLARPFIDWTTPHGGR